MAIVVRRYSFVGPSNGDLARYVGNAAAQSALIPTPVVVDLQVDNTVVDATTTLDDYMKLIGWVYDPTASDPPLKVQDEGVSTGPRRSTMNFIGFGVGAVDNPGAGRVDVTIPGSVTDGAVVERSTYYPATVATSSASYVDATGGVPVVVPINGDYLILFESEALNQNASAVLEIALSKNSLVAALADSERRSQGNASDRRSVITTKRENGLVAGNLIRALVRRLSGAGTVQLDRRRLTIIKVQ